MGLADPAFAFKKTVSFDVPTEFCTRSCVRFRCCTFSETQIGIRRALTSKTQARCLLSYINRNVAKTNLTALRNQAGSPVWSWPETWWLHQVGRAVSHALEREDCVTKVGPRKARA